MRSLYLETSFWSRLVDPPESRKSVVTAAFLRDAGRRHHILVSNVVIDELLEIKAQDKRRAVLELLSRSDATRLAFDPEASRIALEILRAGRWSARRFADMLHVAYTIRYRADALVTWDLDDLARERPRSVVHAYTRGRGLLTPMIGTPEEVAQWLELRIDR
jgi:predicted nucleic acid-binding protein